MSYKRFSSPDVLKRLDFKLLLKFLRPYKDYLCGKGLAWTEDSEVFDYSVLAGIIIKSPDTPEELLDGLFFIDELSSDENIERLELAMETAGIRIETNEVSAEDLVLLAWLQAPKIVERVHAERFLTKSKTFLSYFAQKAIALKIDSTSIALNKIEENLDNWFEFKKRGRGVRGFLFSREDGVWFLVRHGQRVKREGTVESGGDSGSVYYRPEKFDVLIYKSRIGELMISADTKGERQIYCQLFGKYFFGSSDYFLFERFSAKYTLQPLIDDGIESLNCSDIEGIVHVRLYELHILHDSDQKDIEVRKANDVFMALFDGGRDLRDEADNIDLIRAKFKIIFADQKERSVTVSPPNKASFGRESEDSVVHDWLKNRGFIIRRENEDRIGADEIVLEVA